MNKNYVRELSLGSKAISRITEVFNSIDADHSGHIDRNEFKNACEKLSLSLTDKEISQCFEADQDSDGRLDFREYSAFISNRLRKTFQDIDRDNSGTIDVNELRHVLRRLGTVRQVTDREVRSMFAKVDTNKNEQIDFEEFSDFFAHLPDPSLVSVTQQWAQGVGIDVGADFAPPPLPPPSLPLYRFLLAGGLGGVVSRTFTAPLERIKLLAQTQRLRQGVVSTFRHIWKTEGVKGLSAGNGANVARVFPYAALVCLAYSNLCKMFPVDSTDSRLEPLWRMAAAATAGTFATVFTHPLDVVRARLTVHVGSEATVARPGIRQTFASLFDNSGFRGFYRGLGPTLLAIAPFLAVQQSSYDYMKTRALRRDMQPSVLLFATCGIAAGTTAQTVVYPLDVIRRRMQVEQEKVTSSKLGGTVQMAKGIIQRQGVRGLYAGLTATYLKVVPAAALSLLVRDACLGRLQQS